MVGFVRILYGFSGHGSKAPCASDGSGQRSATAPGVAWPSGGMVLHQVTFPRLVTGCLPVVSFGCFTPCMYSIALGGVQRKRAEIGQFRSGLTLWQERSPLNG